MCFGGGRKKRPRPTPPPPLPAPQPAPAPAPPPPPAPPPAPVPVTPLGSSARISLKRSKRDERGLLGRRRSLRRERPPRVNTGGSSSQSGGLNTGGQ